MLIIPCVALTACEPLVTIRVENDTDEMLRIFNDDVFVDDASPQGEVRYQTEVIYPRYITVAEDMEGNIVFKAEFTRDDVSGKETYKVTLPPMGKGALAFQIQNQGDEIRKLYLNNEFIRIVPQRSIVTFETFGTKRISPVYNIVLKDVEGSMVYTSNFTRDDVIGKTTYQVIIPMGP